MKIKSQYVDKKNLIIRYAQEGDRLVAISNMIYLPSDKPVTLAV